MREQTKDLAGGGRIVRGSVATDGSINFGTGFLVTKGATGSYTVTFLQPFKSTPVVVAVCGGPIGTTGVMCVAESANTNNVSIKTYNGSAAATDSQFTFIAIEAIG